MGASWASQKKKLLFWSVILFYTTRTSHLFIGLWHAMKSRFYMTTGNDQLSGWTEKLQSQSCPPKRSWSLFRGPLQLSESWRNHYIWEVFSANQWDALKTAMSAPSTGQQKGPSSFPEQRPTTLCTTKALKVEGAGLQSFASSIHSPDLLLTY